MKAVDLKFTQEPPRIRTIVAQENLYRIATPWVSIAGYGYQHRQTKTIYAGGVLVLFRNKKWEKIEEILTDSYPAPSFFHSDAAAPSPTGVICLGHEVVAQMHGNTQSLPPSVAFWMSDNQYGTFSDLPAVMRECKLDKVCKQDWGQPIDWERFEQTFHHVHPDYNFVSL